MKSKPSLYRVLSENAKKKNETKIKDLFFMNFSRSLLLKSFGLSGKRQNEKVYF